MGLVLSAAAGLVLVRYRDPLVILGMLPTLVAAGLGLVMLTAYAFRVAVDPDGSSSGSSSAKSGSHGRRSLGTEN